MTLDRARAESFGAAAEQYDRGRMPYPDALFDDFAELRAGFAEVIKHGVIADADYFARVVARLPRLVADDGAADPALGEIVAQNLQGWPVQAVPVPHDTTA